MAFNEEALRFYEMHYDMIGAWLLRPGDKVMLGDKQRKVCRFCGKAKPAVTFRKVAHAIPESLGNRSIESAYECDTCNEFFGSGIEHHLGNWSKPLRTFARIRGKSGVPTLKKGGDQSWRVEYDTTSGFRITSYEHDPFYEIDEEKKLINFRLKRDPYIPVAVLKAFMKVGITLMPEKEIANFGHLKNWIMHPDHSIPFAENCPIIYSFQAGPMPNDLIAAFILRRKPSVKDFPYAYLVLAYGNEVFQVQLPSREYDEAMNSQPIGIRPFPSPGSPDPQTFGPVRHALLRLTGREEIRGEMVPLVVGYLTTPPTAVG